MRKEYVYLNPYNIEGPCLGPPSLDGGCLTQHELLASASGEGAQQTLQDLSQTVVPCMNVSGCAAYLGQQTVQDALHVLPGTAPGAWDVCSQFVNYTQYAPTMVPIYMALHGVMDILVYSGDVDSCVPYLGTAASLESLNFTRHGDDWTRWFINDTHGLPQVAGYQRVWDSPALDAGSKLFAYATVRDAGHMVPTFKPQEALALFKKYLDRSF